MFVIVAEALDADHPAIQYTTNYTRNWNVCTTEKVQDGPKK